MSSVRNAINILFNKRYLVITNTVGSGILMGLGDLTTQKIEGRMNEKNAENTVQRSIDWQRMGRLAVVGLCMGPFLHVWYRFLDRRYAIVNIRSIAKKVLFDQTIASPLIIVYFFIGTGFLEGRSFSRSLEELKCKFLTVYLVDLVIWPPAQTINFFLLPPRFRVIYVAFLTYGYNIFLSFMKHMEEKAQQLVDFVEGLVRTGN